MLRVKIGLGAVRTGELPVGVLLRYLILGRGSTGGRRGRPAGSAGENASAALRADDVCRLVALGQHGRLRH